MKLVARLFLSVSALLVFAPCAVAGTSVVNQAGRLAITGDGGPNDVSIDFDEGSSAYVVTVGGGLDTSSGCVPLSAGRLSCPRDAGGGSFRIDAAGHEDSCSLSSEGLFGGNDSFRVGYGSDDVYPGDRVAVELGPGDDFFGGSEARDLALGEEGSDVLDGAEGNDVLSGGAPCGGLSPGSDQVFGGPGSDLLYDGDSMPVGPDALDGGACSAAAHSACPAVPPAEASGDYDSVTYRLRTGDLTLNLADGAASQGESGEGDTVRNVEHADTGDGDDTVTGNAAANIINTNGGNDTVDVSGDPYPAYADLVACGPGSDTATGDAHDIFKYELGDFSNSAGICETEKRIETRTGGGGGAGAGGGTGGTGGAGGGGPTVDRTLASVARELAEAARALERCGITALLEKRGCRDSFTAPGPGAVAYRVTAAAVIARARRATPAAGSYPVRVKATKKGRKRLRKARRLRATLTVTFTGSTGTVAKRSRKIILTRRKQ